MNIKDFIAEYNNATDKEKAIKKHVTVDYVDFERKITICNLIAKKLILDNGDLVKNTPLVYEQFVLTLVREYTDIEISSEECLMAFNFLERNGITALLIAAIGKDAKTFNTVLDMTINDAVDNHNNLVNHLNLKSDNINFIFDKMQDIIKELSTGRTALVEG